MSTALLAALCGCHSQWAAHDKHELVRIADDEVKSLDPQAVSDLASLRVAADQFEGLTRFDARGRIEPGLAAQWHSSSDGLMWTFRLRPNLRFSDGKLITPQTFSAVFDRLRRGGTTAPARPLFAAIKSLSAVGANVIIHLNAPFPALPELLAHPAIAALPLYRSQWLSERPMITSGAYRLRDWALNDHLTLIRNTAWHDGLARIREIRWQPVSDPLAALRQFEAGEADTTSDFPSSRLSSLRVHYGSAVHIAPYNGSYYFVFNTRTPPFDDVRVRQALNMTVDRSWISGPLLHVGNVPAYGVVPPSVGNNEPYVPDWAGKTRTTRYDEARRLLAAAGYGRARRLRFEIRFNSETDHRRVAIILAALWRPLGVDAHLLNSEAALHFAALRRGDFAVARSGWIGDIAAPENYLALYRSDAGPTNYSGYANPKFDAAFDHALGIAEPHERALAMRKAEAILMADAPVIPINYYVSKSLVASRVGGWHDNPAHIHPSRTLWIKG